MNVSSIGGRMTYPFVSLYHSTKWAIEGFSESLAYELGELGIQVKLIEPGGVETDFGGRSMDFAMPDDFPDYAPSVQNLWPSAPAMGLQRARPNILRKVSTKRLLMVKPTPLPAG